MKEFLAEWVIVQLGAMGKPLASFNNRGNAITYAKALRERRNLKCVVVNKKDYENDSEERGH